MGPNESILGRTGETISFSGDYRAACCAIVKQLTERQSFPNCSDHGETQWSWIPPFVQSDFGMRAVVAHWKHLQSQWHHAAMSQPIRHAISVYETVGVSESVTPHTGNLSLESTGPEVQTNLEILLQHEIIVVGSKTNEGQIIEAVTPAWFAVLNKIIRDQISLYEFSKHAREFEEMIAGAYERDGWTVVLTPRSGDKRVDIIVARREPVEIRMVDQVKAYSPNYPVTAEDVDVMLGVLNRDPGATKGVITTTSQFAPGIEKEEGIKKFIPYRLELKNGKQIRDWLSALYRVMP